MKISIRSRILGLTVGVLGVAHSPGSRVGVALLRPDRLFPTPGAGYRFRP